jgi:hypothetical protein
VRILANVSQTVFTQNLFGFFEQVRKRRFAAGHEGLFRRASGASRFIDLYTYEGDEAFSEDQAFLVNISESAALPLEPLIFWHTCNRHADTDAGHCYLFDTISKDVASYKAVGYSCVEQIGQGNGDFGQLSHRLAALASVDQPVELVKIAALESRRRD